MNPLANESGIIRKGSSKKSKEEINLSYENKTAKNFKITYNTLFTNVFLSSGIL